MTAYLLINHLFNFMAPAAFVAMLLPLLSRLVERIFKQKRHVAQSIPARIAIIFTVNLAVLGAGLVFFGTDAKMATYAAMVVAAAICQWVLGSGWRAGA